MKPTGLNTMTQSVARKVGRRLIYVAVTIALLIAVGECGLRVVGSALHPDVAVRNYDLPDCDAIVVLTIGDSMTFGLGTQKRSQSYPMQLNRFWKKAYPKVPLKVFNLGVPGTNSSEGKMLLEKFFKTSPEVIADFTFILYGVNNRWNLRNASFWEWDQSARKDHLFALAASKLQLSKTINVVLQAGMETAGLEAAVKNRGGYYQVVRREGWSAFFNSFHDDLLVRWIEHDYKVLAEQLTARNIQPVFLSYFTLPFPGLNPLIRRIVHDQNSILLDIERPRRFFTHKRMWARDWFHLNARGYRRVAKDVIRTFKQRFDQNAIEARLQKKRQSPYCSSKT